jgi:hypothetical protein
MPRRRNSPSNAEAAITIYRNLEGKPTQEDDENSLSYHILVSGNYSPGRPPPPCSDHDHPNFSDPGDGPEFDYGKIEIDEVVDWEGEPVVEGHALFGRVLKPEQIELTSAEDDSLYEALGSSYDHDDGPDPDEAYERWRDRQDDDC